MKALWYIKYYQDGLGNLCSPNGKETTGMGDTAVIYCFVIAVVSSVTVWNSGKYYLLIYFY